MQDVFDKTRFIQLDELPDHQGGKTYVRVFFKEKNQMIPSGFVALANSLILNQDLGFRMAKDTDVS